MQPTLSPNEAFYLLDSIFDSKYTYLLPYTPYESRYVAMVRMNLWQDLSFPFGQRNFVDSFRERDISNGWCNVTQIQIRFDD